MDARSRSWARFVPTPKTASALYLLALVFGISALWIPGLFFTSATFRLVLSDQVVVCLLALAVLVPFTAGAFDLSVGSMLAFSIVITSWLQANTDVPVALACAASIVACTACGALSGLITVRFNVNSFIATLGMSQVLSAATLYISENRQIVGVFSQDFLSLGRGNWFGVPKVVFYLTVIALALWYVLELTPLGRRMYAVGANAEAARLVGIKTDWMVAGSLAASAGVAALAGTIYSAQAGSFSNSFGPPLLFPAFAALFFGSTQFKPRPNVWGTVLAVYVLAFGVKCLQLGSSTGTYWITPLFNGAALLIAVSTAGRASIAGLRRRGAARVDEHAAQET